MLKLIRKKVITQNLEMQIKGLNDKDAKEALFAHLLEHAKMDTLKEYCEVIIEADGYPRMQDLGRNILRNIN